MRVFCIGDLHLPGNAQKPMDVFGPAWNEHPSRIEAAWRDTVATQDLVLVPGDISWAMHMKDAAEDFAWLRALPGTKLILRGNHDYWWNSITKVRALLGEGCFALQNDAFELGEFVIAGSRGWVCPGSAGFKEGEDRAIYERELIRLEMSLEAASRYTDKTLIVMLHFPPFNERRTPSGFTALAERYGAKFVLYGHLHDKACACAFEGVRNGIQYRLCSADHIGFAPRLITEN